MIHINKFVVGTLSTNCYLLTDKKSKETIVIDPGDDADYISNYIQSNNLKLSKIIATHGHIDHILGVMQLKLIFNTKFYMNKNDKFLIAYLEKSAKYYFKQDKILKPTVDKNIDEKSKITFAGKKIKIINTPGHTPGSISLYFKDKDALFVGDLMFYNGSVGRTDFSYSNKEDLQKSIYKILEFPKSTNIYSGHGEDTTIYNELKFHEKKEN